jgi:hypothetical protein
VSLLVAVALALTPSAKLTPPAAAPLLRLTPRLAASLPPLRSASKFPGLLVQGGFMTPSGNIACNVGRLGPGTKGPLAIGCALYSKTDKRYGIATWWMKTTGPALWGYIVANPATDYPKLAYGRAYAWHGIRCSSAATGLTCRNRSGHGFFLSLARQTIF